MRTGRGQAPIQAEDTTIERDIKKRYNYPQQGVGEEPRGTDSQDDFSEPDDYDKDRPF